MSPPALCKRYRRLTGAESANSALAARSGKSSKLPKAKVKCTYKPCRKTGHTEAECWKKKRDLENEDSGSLKEKEKKKEKKEKKEKKKGGEESGGAGS